MPHFAEETATTPEPSSLPSANPMSFDIFDLVSPPPSASPPATMRMSRDIICYPITNITRPLNLFGEFPRSKAFIPPTPPVRESSISNYYFNDMLLMSTDTVDHHPSAESGCARKTISVFERGSSSVKDQKNLANSSRLNGSCGRTTAKGAVVHCKRYSRALSEPRRSTPSPVAFGRSISKERTFAEEKKKLEQISPQCKKANLTTRILKKGEYKSSEDLRKAIHKTVLGKKATISPPNQMTENKYTVTYQKKGGNQKWTSFQSANKCQKLDQGDKLCVSRKTDCKQITRNERTNSVSSLARTNSTYSIESTTTKSCEPIKCKFFGTRQIVKLGAFVASSMHNNNSNKKAAAEKPTKEKVKSSTKTTAKGKCHPVTNYLSTKKPVTTSKFKIIDRNRSVSPVRSPRTGSYASARACQNEVILYPKARSEVVRSKSQPPRMVEIQTPERPTVIHVKPERIVPCPQTYHSLPRMSRHSTPLRYVRQYREVCGRAKSEGPLIEVPGEEVMSDRWSASTPSLNAVDKNADIWSYRNTDRFLELNQLYSHLERVGELQKVTSQSDLRPIRKKEEVVDYELWKKIRMREKAQKELDFLINQLKSNQKMKRFHFERDVDSIRWNGENEPALRHKSMSVENLKEYFTEMGLLADRSPAIEMDSLEITGQATPVKVSKAIDTYENQLGMTISPTLMSTLSVDQVLKLKTQLRQIYSSESSSLADGGPESSAHKRSRSQDSQTLGKPVGGDVRPPKKFNTITKTHLSEEDKKSLQQSICSEIKEAVEQRRRHKSLDTTRISDSDDNQSDVGCRQPAVDVMDGQPKDIQGKITFFEKKPLEVSGTTIYHARDTSSDDEVASSSMPAHLAPGTTVDGIVVPDPNLLNRRSHSFSDLKEMFGERMHESHKCRSVSPSLRFAAAAAAASSEVRAASALDQDNNTQSSASESATDGDQTRSMATAQKSQLKIDDGDVSWMAHKYETIATVRGRCRKRRTVSGAASSSSSCLKQDCHVLMPHIDIISKTAALQLPSRICVPPRPAAKTGEVEKMKTFFENKHKSSLLGEMFTSEPDISKLRDASVYLSGSWVAHQYPKKEDNFLSLPRVIDPQQKLAKKKLLAREKLRSLSISPSRKLSILKQCIFPYKIFDEEKLDNVANIGQRFSAVPPAQQQAAEKDAAEKVAESRKRKDRRDTAAAVNDEG